MSLPPCPCSLSGSCAREDATVSLDPGIGPRSPTVPLSSPRTDSRIDTFEPFPCPCFRPPGGSRPLHTLWFPVRGLPVPGRLAAPPMAKAPPLIRSSEESFVSICSKQPGPRGGEDCCRAPSGVHRTCVGATQPRRSEPGWAGLQEGAATPWLRAPEDRQAFMFSAAGFFP